MPGLMPGIHVFMRGTLQDVDGRDKPGHDASIQIAIARFSAASSIPALSQA